MDGSGGFGDIFKRWDIRNNTIISFSSSGNDKSPHHLVMNDSATLASEVSVQSFGAGGYGTGPTVKIGGNGLNVTARLLKKQN